jgi:pyrroline-5-carboxylate reductase
MNICFIGGGNMASAMIGGLLLNGTCKPGDIRVVEINDEARQRLADKGVMIFTHLEEQAIRGCEVIVLAVKPQQMEAVATQLAKSLSGQVVLTIAAGIRLTDLRRWLLVPDSNYILVRAMPNTPALVGAGMTGLSSLPPKHSLTPQELERVSAVETIIASMGAFVWVRSEEEMDAVTAISGSGPAYFFYFIEALEQAGKDIGLPAETARMLALETALGAAKLAHDSPEDPATLRARVTSKNGTTERALLSMESNQVKQHIISAAKAAAARAKEMGDELGSA